VILFDQRGAGKSTPLGEWRNNTTQLLIEDIERLRKLFGIERWLVFGGSWGSTLALAYGQAHPERCLGFVLRGIFLCTPAEIEFFLYGVQWFYPELYDEFIAPIPVEERGDLLQGLYPAPAVRRSAAVLAGGARLEPLRGPPRVPAAAGRRHLRPTRSTWAWAGSNRTTWPTAASWPTTS
jgi:pimeloyl-ACP methyl ester carboxylesterase